MAKMTIASAIWYLLCLSGEVKKELSEIEILGSRT
jgi:hypothetical protein